jgi:hypothetical protein
MHRPEVADAETVSWLARVRAEREGRPRCRTDLGLRSRPLGRDRSHSSGGTAFFLPTSSPVATEKGKREVRRRMRVQLKSCRYTDIVGGK